MNHTQVIQHFIKDLTAKSYLEIGLGDLTNFNAIECEYKCGVDPNFIGTENVDYISDAKLNLLKMDSDAFFALAGNQAGIAKFDVIFLDGLHHAEQLRLDIENALQLLNPGGVIIVHDINPLNEEMTAVPRQTKQWTGDVYKTWYAFNKRAKGANIISLEDDFGVGIIAPGPDFKLTKVAVKNITYKEYKEWIKEQFTQL